MVETLLLTKVSSSPEGVSSSLVEGLPEVAMLSPPQEAKQAVNAILAASLRQGFASFGFFNKFVFIMVLEFMG